MPYFRIQVRIVELLLTHESTVACPPTVACRTYGIDLRRLPSGKGEGTREPDSEVRTNVDYLLRTVLLWGSSETRDGQLGQMICFGNLPRLLFAARGCFRGAIAGRRVPSSNGVASETMLSGKNELTVCDEYEAV